MISRFCSALTLFLWASTAASPLADAAVVNPTPASASIASAGRLKVFGAASSSTRSANGLAQLDGALGELALSYPALDRDTALSDLHVLNPAARFRLSPPLAAPEVLVDAVSRGDPQALAAALENLGLENVAVFSNDVGGWLPMGQLAAAAALAELHHMRAAMPRTRAGAVITQGDFVARSDVIRSTTPLTGNGITVGVLSDSFNCYAAYASSRVPASGNTGYAQNGFTANFAEDVDTGDLPAKVNVIEEANCLNYGAPEQLPFSDEGRAILQIIHDVAPGAGLAFHTATNSEADFANGILALASSAGATVIDDDVGYPDEPVFQDGLLAQAVDQVAALGVAYFSAAGNDGANSYENNAPSFPVSSSAAPNAGEELLNFDTSGKSTAIALPLTIPALQPGEYISLVMEWDQPYVTGAPGSPGSANSMDLCVIGNVGDQLTNLDGNAKTCTGPNTIGSDPVQVLELGNPANSRGSSAAENISIAIGLAKGSPPGRVKFLLLGDGAPVAITSYSTNSPTLQGHPGAAGAAAVGAAFYFQTPLCGATPAILESYSSLGGDPILFDTSGNRLATPQIRMKPDFVGPDGVNDTFLGSLNGQMTTAIAQCENATRYPDFFGTSAAAPHAAAIAALMLEANPADTPSQIYSALQNSALAMGGSSGFNYASGYGLIQADSALALLPPGAPSLSANPTTLTVGGSTTVSWNAINASGCTASGSWSGALAASGSQSETPAAIGSYPYMLSCSNAAGLSSTSSVTVIVAAPGSGGSSGGSLDLESLLGLGMLLILGRQRRIAKYLDTPGQQP